MVEQNKVTIDDLEESIANLRQIASTATGRMERMAIALGREGQTKMAETAAKDTEAVS